MLHPFVAGDICETGLGSFCGVGTGFTSPYRHDPAHLALRSALHPPEKADDQYEGQQDREHTEEWIRTFGPKFDIDIAVAKKLEVGFREFDGPFTCVGGSIYSLSFDSSCLVGDDNRIDFAVSDLVYQAAVVDCRTGFAVD